MRTATIENQTTEKWCVPVIFDTKNVFVHLNPHYGTNLSGNKWTYCITLKCKDTPAIIRLSNLSKAKELATHIDNYITDNGITYDWILSDIKTGKNIFRSFVIDSAILYSVNCHISDGCSHEISRN